jgi:hypothetical protein
MSETGHSPETAQYQAPPPKSENPSVRNVEKPSTPFATDQARAREGKPEPTDVSALRSKAQRELQQARDKLNYQTVGPDTDEQRAISEQAYKEFLETEQRLKPLLEGTKAEQSAINKETGPQTPEEYVRERIRTTRLVMEDMYKGENADYWGDFYEPYVARLEDILHRRDMQEIRAEIEEEMRFNLEMLAYSKGDATHGIPPSPNSGLTVPFLEKRLTRLSMLRLQLPANPPATSPNIEGSQRANPEQPEVPLEEAATQFNEQVHHMQKTGEGTVDFRLANVYPLYRRLKNEGEGLPTTAAAQAQRTIEMMLKTANEDVPGLFGYTYEDTYSPQTSVGAYDNRRVEGRIEDAFRSLTEALTAYELSGKNETRKQAIVTSIDAIKSRLQAAGIVGNAQVPNISELEPDSIIQLYEERIVDLPHIMKLPAAA